MKTFGRVLCVAAGLSLLGACGEEKKETAAALPDPCTLVTGVDLKERLGIEFEAPESRQMLGEGKMGSNANCSYTSVDNTDPTSLSDVKEILQNSTYVIVDAWAWPSKEAASTYLQSMRDGGLGEVEELSGPGDEAIRIDGRFGSVITCENGLCIGVSVSRATMDPAEDKATELELTDLAVSRL